MMNIISEGMGKDGLRLAMVTSSHQDTASLLIYHGGFAAMWIIARG